MFMQEHSITVETSAVKHPKPEWLGLRDAVKLFGIGRSSLYKLMDAGAIKSACLRNRGNIRGKRLVSFDSLAAYVESFAAPEAMPQRVTAEANA